MASTNKTTNYELSQFEGTDKPSWEADYNADMLIIDTNLKAVSDVASGASGDISTLDGRLTTAEGDISTNANDIDALEGRADALEAGQTSDDGRLDALEAEQIIQNTAIEGNTQLAYNIARPYDSASTYAIKDYTLFQNTLYKCTTAVTTGEAFDPTKWTAIKVMDELSEGGNFIYLDNTNTTFTLNSPNYLKETNYYSGTYSSSNGTFTNTAISILNNAGDNFYTEIGNLAILNLYLKFDFDALQVDSRDKINFRFEATINNSDIKAPNKTCVNINNDDTANNSNHSKFTSAKKIITEFFFYRPNTGSANVSDRSARFTFIYPIS